MRTFQEPITRGHIARFAFWLGAVVVVLAAKVHAQQGACCDEDGNCTLVMATECESPAVFVSNSVCTPQVCQGACCHPNGSCTLVATANCVSPGVFSSIPSTCGPDACPQPGACCFFGMCSITLPADCATGPVMPGVTCEANQCVQPGLCSDYTISPGPATYIAGTTGIGNHGVDAVTAYPLPFAVTFYGATRPAGEILNISSNGLVWFGPVAEPQFATCLPTFMINAEAIFPLWAKSTTAGTAMGQGIFTSLIGAAGSRVFVIEWRSRRVRDDGSLDPFTPAAALPPDQAFELVFYENQPYFDVVYQSVPQSGVDAIATVGVQHDYAGPHAARATQFVCQNEVGGLIPNGLSLRFTCAQQQPGACCTQGACTVVSSVYLCPSSAFAAGMSCSPDPCPAVRPSNDLCVNAVDLSSVTMPHNVISDARGATTDLLGGTGYIAGTWFSFTAPSAGFLTYTENHRLFDVSSDASYLYHVALFSLMLDDCQGFVIPGHYGDPMQFPPFTDSSGDLAYAMQPGERVRIAVHAFPFTPKPLYPYDLTFNFIPFTPVAPTNDTCGSAVNLNSFVLPYSGYVDNTDAVSEQTSCGELYRGVWYQYTAPTRGRLFCAEVGSQPIVWVTAADCSASPACIGTAAGQFDLQVFTLNAGQTMRLCAASTLPNLGASPVPLNVSFTFAPSPANDDCASAIDLNSVAFPFSTVIDNTIASDDAVTCPNSPLPHGVWFTYTAAQHGTLLADAADRSTNLDVSGPAQSPVWASAPSCGSGAVCLEEGPSVRVPLNPGQSVKVLLASNLVDIPDRHSKFDVVVHFASACPADFNRDGNSSIDDLFLFLNAWFTGDPRADMNGNGVSIDDLFQFLNFWFSGC